MRIQDTSWVFRMILVGGGVLVAAAAGRADIVFFRDGFVLNGKVAQQNETIVDPASGQALRVGKGQFFVIDGARRITFSHHQVQTVDKKDLYGDSELVRFSRPVSRLNSLVMDPVLHVFGVSPWDGRWERDIEIGTISNGQRRRYKIRQRLFQLTPQYARIEALRYNWSSYYMTNELGVEEVRKLLESHSDLREMPAAPASAKKNDEPPPKKKNQGPTSAKAKPKAATPEPQPEPASAAMKRLRIARFLAQAGWYDEAEKEYADISKEFPDEREKVNAGREQLRGLRHLQLLEAIELASQAKQHARAQQLLAAFPRTDVDEALQARARTIRGKYETSNDALKQAGRLLKDVIGRATEKRLQEAAAAILAELNHDNVSRLEHFGAHAQQAEREREQKRDPDKTPDQLLALAATGWLLGKDAAEPKVDNAKRLWISRQFVLDYLKEDDGDAREKLLQAYLGKTEDVAAFDEVAQLIPNLPPVSPDKNAAPDVPIELKARDLSGKKDGLSYWLQLPPEYQHGRAYPVVFALHQTGEGPKAMLARCGYHAALHGYILVAPSWGGETGARYAYSPEEHAAVLNVLWDLSRRFHVDSDRVFVLGVGEGANMAFDVGLSHPDAFAGVLAVSGSAQFFALRYGRDGGNGQNLPFYVVNGTIAGDLSKANHDLFERAWVPQGYPALHIEYGGRGLEWFAAESPSMFDWMDHKRRTAAFPSLGKHDFFTMRETDNHFYWISVDSLRAASLNDFRTWSPRVLPATVSANVGEGNLIALRTRGIKRLTVWLGRDAQGRDMVDFTKPVTVKVNGGVLVNKRPVKPSLQTMLEDFYRRGDCRHLFFVKEQIEIK